MSSKCFFIALQPELRVRGKAYFVNEIYIQVVNYLDILYGFFHSTIVAVRDS